jgi:hypothetical protein
MVAWVLVKVRMGASCFKVAKGMTFGPPKWGDHIGRHATVRNNEQRKQRLIVGLRVVG